MPTRGQFADPDATQQIDAVTEPPDRPIRTKRRRGRRIALIIFAVLCLLLGGTAVAASVYLHSVESSVKRVDAFDEVPDAARPAKAPAAKGALNFLVLGSDTRDPQNTGGSRSDTIILLHLDKTQSGAQVVSIPRDTWTRVPKSKDGKHGGVDAKINAAYAWGGVPLTVQTIEAFTGVRIDHVVMVDFSGFKEIIDALGGVTIDVEASFTSTHSLNADSIRHFDKGPQVMDGAAALDYARERYAFKDGDFARIRHQQQMIKAVLDKASSGGLLTNPGRLNAFLRATANAVTVDSTLDIFDMAMQLRHLRSENLTFYTNPTKGTGTVGTESVVFPDTAKDKPFYDAIRSDQPMPPGTAPN
jgi:LCP family protein required for cell wall assembly